MSLKEVAQRAAGVLAKVRERLLQSSRVEIPVEYDGVHVRRHQDVGVDAESLVCVAIVETVGDNPARALRYKNRQPIHDAIGHEVDRGVGSDPVAFHVDRRRRGGHAVDDWNGRQRVGDRGLSVAMLREFLETFGRVPVRGRETRAQQVGDPRTTEAGDTRTIEQGNLTPALAPGEREPPFSQSRKWGQTPEAPMNPPLPPP